MFMLSGFLKIEEYYSLNNIVYKLARNVNDNAAKIFVEIWLSNLCIPLCPSFYQKVPLLLVICIVQTLLLLNNKIHVSYVRIYVLSFIECICNNKIFRNRSEIMQVIYKQPLLAHARGIPP